MFILFKNYIFQISENQVEDWWKCREKKEEREKGKGNISTKVARFDK